MPASSYNPITLVLAVIALVHAPGCKQHNTANHSRAQATPPSPVSAELGRTQFTAAMHQVKPGMSPDDVRRLLGEPEDIVTDVDLSPGYGSAPFEAWNYGTSGHNTFPMLGSVVFRDGVVDTRTGHSEFEEDEDNQRPLILPPSTELISESELRHLLGRIRAAIEFQGFSVLSFDPLPFIPAVNALQSAGTEKAIAALKEYARLRSNENDLDDVLGIECILKAAFDTGGAISDPPGLITSLEDLADTPQHPLLILDGIPFYVAPPFGFGGGVPDPMDAIEFFERFGQIRTAPLIPPNHPIETLNKIVAQELAGSDEVTPEVETNIREPYLQQIRRLVRTAHPLPLDVDGRPEPIYFDCDGVVASQIQREIDQLAIRWDAKQQIYVRSDGTFMPDPPPLHRARIYWRPSSLTVFTGHITLKRSSPAYTWVDLEWERPTAYDETQFTVRFTGDGTPLVEFLIPRPRPRNPSADEFDDLCRHITILSDRVGPISEMNDNPSAYVEVLDGQSIRVDVLTEDGRIRESREVIP